MGQVCPQDGGASQPTDAIGLYQNEIEGRFRKIPARDLALVWWLYREGHVTHRQLRVYFAAHEMAERRRCAAPRRGAAANHAYYGLAEVKTLVGGRGSARADAELASDLRALARIGLVTVTDSRIDFGGAGEIKLDDMSGYADMLAALPHPNRSVPVPRRTLRALAAGFSRTVTAVMIALLIRSLFWRKAEGRYRTDGRTKLSWVAEVFGVSRRAVTQARSHLVDIGWLEPIEENQWALNRWGLHDRINVDWKGEGRAARPVDNSVAIPTNDNSESASPSPVTNSESASPVTDKKTSYENFNTRKPGEHPGPRSGFSRKQGEGESAKPPRLSDIRLHDLRDTERLLDLHHQAVSKGLAKSSEAGELEFVSLAERAIARARNPGGMFAWLLQGNRVAFITQTDEDRAIARLREYRHGKHHEARESVAVPESRLLSEDELFVEKCIAVAKRCGGIDPYHVARQLEGWPREKWELQQSAYTLKDRRHWLERSGCLEDAC